MKDNQDIAGGEHSVADELDEHLVDLVDKHFPKGIAKERGQANVLLAYFLMWHNRQLAATLRTVLANGHGGGNWRRLLTSEIDKLEGNHE